MRRTLPIFALVLLAGCRVSLDVNRTFDNPPDGTFVEVDPVGRAQTINVSATADAPVNVLVFLKKDRDAVEKEEVSKQYTAKTLAKGLKGESHTLQAPIPANEAAMVYVTNATARRANVKLKITN